MTFIAIGTITLLVSWLLCWRRAVEQRAIRWDLYRKRDELRRLAIDNPGLLDSDIFQTLDKQLTSHCVAFKYVSLWTLVPVLVMADRKKSERIATKLRHQVASATQLCDGSDLQRYRSFICAATHVSAHISYRRWGYYHRGHLGLLLHNEVVV